VARLRAALRTLSPIGRPDGGTRLFAPLQGPVRDVAEVGRPGILTERQTEVVGGRATVGPRSLTFKESIDRASRSGHLQRTLKRRFPHFQYERRPQVLLQACTLSVRIATAMIGDCVPAPHRMIPLPPVKSPKHYRITDQPSAGVIVHILATAQADVFIPIPNIAIGDVSLYHGREPWRHLNDWW